MALKRTQQMMKGFVLGSLFLTLPHSFDRSFAATTGNTRVVMNFRASPNGKDIGRVSPDETFTILKDTGGWVKIKRRNGRVGWVWKKYVTINESRTTSAPASTQTSSAEAIAEGVVTGVKPHLHLNVRSGPSTRNREVGSLKPGEKFEILGEAKNGWYQIRSADGTVGYASDRYITKKSTPQPANVPIPTPRPQREQLAEASEDIQPASGRFADVTSDDLISAYAPEEQATAALEQLEQLGQGGSLQPASAGSTSADSEVEAECDDCLLQTASMTGPNRDVFEIPSHILEFHRREFAESRTQSEREKCYGEVILKAAKENVRRRYGNRSYSAGICAYGVRTSLQRAGVNRVGALGDALMYYKQSSNHEGTLAQLGFVNEISKYRTAENAPPGSVLVFGGPYSNRVLRNPGRYLRGGRIIRRHGGSAGDYVGHVTIKGDDNRYYTDGRTTDPAIANRHLVGIFVLKECKSCTASVKRKCGG